MNSHIFLLSTVKDKVPLSECANGWSHHFWFCTFNTKLECKSLKELIYYLVNLSCFFFCFFFWLKKNKQSAWYHCSVKETDKAWLEKWVTFFSFFFFTLFCKLLLQIVAFKKPYHPLCLYICMIFCVVFSFFISNNGSVYLKDCLIFLLHFRKGFLNIVL